MARRPIPPKYTDGIKGYEADEQGNIYSPDGTQLKPTPVKGGTSNAGGPTSTGHLKVHIGDKWPYVSRLVAAAFGEKIDGKEVLHSNDQKNGFDNKRANLRAGTREENVADRKRLRDRMAEKMTGGKDA